MPPTAFFPLLARLLLIVLTGGPVLAQGASFDHGPYHIEVQANTDALMSTTDYEITVANEELTLTRLLAPLEGTLSKSFVTDLDRDGGFEVVVTFSHDEGQQTGLHIYRWKEYLLEPVAVAGLDDVQSIGYRGGDEFAVIDGVLVRIFQVYEQTGDAWQMTAVQRRLRYSVQESRWVADP
jgi:hypothetical protein